MSSTSQPLPAHWSPEIIKNYMDSVNDTSCDSEPELDDKGSDFDTDTDMDSSDDSVFEISVDSITIPERPAHDITADDDAFSSDDEYGQASALAQEEMKLKKQLIMGIVPDSLKCSSMKICLSLRWDLLKQLECAEQEYAEITNTQLVTYPRRSSDESEEEMVARLRNMEIDTPLEEFRLKSSKEVCDEDRSTLFREIVLLAQAVFRQEREVKRFYTL